MTDTRPITQRLKEDTRELHTRAEKGSFQRALLRGGLSRDAYLAMLGQLWLVHSALESELREFADKVPAIARVVRPEQHQQGYLEEDLAHFGVDAAGITPTSGTRAFVQMVERATSEPIRLLGIHYVLEGSNNGNRFIARAVGSALGVASGDPGTRYLDPYGEAQREKWKQFKADLEACNLTETEMRAMVDAAEDTFRAMIHLYEDLAETLDPDVVTRATGAPAGA